MIESGQVAAQQHAQHTWVICLVNSAIAVPEFCGLSSCCCARLSRAEWLPSSTRSACGRPATAAKTPAARRASGRAADASATPASRIGTSACRRRSSSSFGSKSLRIRQGKNSPYKCRRQATLWGPMHAAPQFAEASATPASRSGETTCRRVSSSSCRSKSPKRPAQKAGQFVLYTPLKPSPQAARLQ